MTKLKCKCIHYTNWQTFIKQNTNTLFARLFSTSSLLVSHVVVPIVRFRAGTAFSSRLPVQIQTRTSPCSAYYVSWPHGTAHICCWMPKLWSRSWMPKLARQQSIDISWPPGSQRQTCCISMQQSTDRTDRWTGKQTDAGSVSSWTVSGSSFYGNMRFKSNIPFRWSFLAFIFLNFWWLMVMLFRSGPWVPFTFRLSIPHNIWHERLGNTKCYFSLLYIIAFWPQYQFGN